MNRLSTERWRRDRHASQLTASYLISIAPLRSGGNRKIPDATIRETGLRSEVDARSNFESKSQGAK
jgi:hypothetical protein